ncbi:hypothetical protein LCGC14_1799680 [marine sediment metagenome]|uniref:Uncharacterized protein n=1 Tax=marine sediment metagenome TaxID=412755 RepID=A0A0F9GPY2_9ZZZZ
MTNEELLKKIDDTIADLGDAGNAIVNSDYKLGDQLSEDTVEMIREVLSNLNQTLT